MKIRKEKIERVKSNLIGKKKHQFTFSHIGGLKKEKFIYINYINGKKKNQFVLY